MKTLQFMTHPMSKTINGKRQRVYRWIIEEYMGRELEDCEHVYHLNGNSNDNRIENLIVIKKKYRKK